MRRHGISGPVEPQDGPSLPFHPYQLARDTLAMAFVFALLVGAAAMFPAPLDELADPTDATYVPRPEWYFLSMFQFLKYLPAQIAGIPGELLGIIFFGALAAILVLLPVLDRKASLGRPSPWWNRLALVALAGALVLTFLALLPPPGQVKP